MKTTPLNREQLRYSTRNFDLGMPFSIDRTQPLPFAWTNGTSGKVQTYLGFATSTRTVSALCTFDAKAGSGTIPSSTLGKLPAMANGSISASVYDQVFTTVGDWALGFTATNTAVTSAMKQAYATATTK
jgi:hypothetical protein